MSFGLCLSANECTFGVPRTHAAVLSQEQSDGKLHPVAFASRALAAPEKNYSITELETLAVVWALKHYHAYLYGHEVMVVTDHSAVKTILNTPGSSGKHDRWWLTGFKSGIGKIKIVYRPGRENAWADTLSRNQVPGDGGESVDLDVQVAQVSVHDTEITQLLQAPPRTVLPNDFDREQRKDVELRKMCDFLERGILPDGDKEAKKVAGQSVHFILVDKILYFVDSRKQGRQRAVVPVHLREKVMSENHAGVMSGHSSGSPLYSALSRSWWWPNMYTDVVSYCRNCGECAIVSGTGKKNRPPLHPIPVQRPFQILGVDIMELPVSKSGSWYMMSSRIF